MKDGITTPGGKLPSERELGELLGIKRMTLNAKEKLDRWLKDGITTPGGKLPSERELGELLGIKRMTLRLAVLNLEAESKIFRKDRNEPRGRIQNLP